MSKLMMTQDRRSSSQDWTRYRRYDSSSPSDTRTPKPVDTPRVTPPAGATPVATPQTQVRIEGGKRNDPSFLECIQTPGLQRKRVKRKRKTASEPPTQVASTPLHHHHLHQLHSWGPSILHSWRSLTQFKSKALRTTIT